MSPWKTYHRCAVCMVDLISRYSDLILASKVLALYHFMFVRKSSAPTKHLVLFHSSIHLPGCLTLARCDVRPSPWTNRPRQIWNSEQCCTAGGRLGDVLVIVDYTLGVACPHSRWHIMHAHHILCQTGPFQRFKLATE